MREPQPDRSRAPRRSRWTAVRTILLLGLLVAGVGVGRLAYFAFWFDTWQLVHVPAPDGLDVAFEEAVLVPRDAREAQAREGTAAAWRMVRLAGVLSVVGATGAWLIRRRSASP